MGSSLEFIEARQQATRDAQTEIAATWVWEEQTVAQWDSRVTDFTARKSASATQEGVMLNKRALFEGTVIHIHDLTVDGVKMARIKWRKDDPRYCPCRWRRAGHSAVGGTGVGGRVVII